MRHCLKITDDRYENIVNGRKKAEVRNNDRDFQFGDSITFTDTKGVSRGDESWIVTHVHSGIGIISGYVVLSIERAAN